MTKQQRSGLILPKFDKHDPDYHVHRCWKCRKPWECNKRLCRGDKTCLCRPCDIRSGGNLSFQDPKEKKK